MSVRKPSQKQIDAFAVEFIQSNDRSKSFYAAFPDTKASPKTVQENACKIAKMPKVRTRIEKLRAELSKQTEVEFKISVQDLKQRLIDIANAGCELKTDKEGNQVPINLTAATAAIAELNRMDGNHAATKQKIDMVVTPKVVVKDLSGELEDKSE